MAEPERTTCTSARCGAPIIFVKVANAAGHKLKTMPLNAAPDPGGNVAVTKQVTGEWRGRVLGHSKPLAHEVVYCPHFATCTDPAEHRRRQRGNWTSVQSAHNAGQRRRRAAPNPQLPGAAPGMTRIYPGRTP